MSPLPDDIPPMHFVWELRGTIDVIFHRAQVCRRVTRIDPAAREVVEAHAQAVEFMLLGNAHIGASA
jgi:hypothetical protein